MTEREWAQFHTPETLSKSISIEAAELLECFQWSPEGEPGRVREELADVLTYGPLLANLLGEDAEELVLEKLRATRSKYRSSEHGGEAPNMTSFEIRSLPLQRERDRGLGCRPTGATRTGRSSTCWMTAARHGEVGLKTVGLCRGDGQRGGAPEAAPEPPVRGRLAQARVVLDARFNKSACLDLESFLIRLLAGDGPYQVLNRNDGITNADYYGREVPADLRRDLPGTRETGSSPKTIREIENTDLFKLSPFKALTRRPGGRRRGHSQRTVRGPRGQQRTTVIRGDPGTGKTIVAIFLMKLLADIAAADATNRSTRDAMLHRVLRGRLSRAADGVALRAWSCRSSRSVVHPAGLRETPGLHRGMVLTPFQVGRGAERVRPA